jgi:segregation and condensation protein B
MGQTSPSETSPSETSPRVEAPEAADSSYAVEFAMQEQEFTEAVLRDLEHNTDGDETTGDDELEDEAAAGELDQYQAADIEQVETLSENEITAAVEALLFATDKPQSVQFLKSAFQGTKVRVADIRAAVERLVIEYSNPARGVTIEEVAGGYQVRTKAELQKYLHRLVKVRPFRLSGPALEVLSIVAYKQPCTKAMVDEVRGVESGHLMRALLDRSLIQFGEKSELPGRPMFYETTKRFLEIFGLRNIQELPTLQEIDQLIPEGIDAEVIEKPKLSDLTGELSTEVAAKSYSENEEELIDIASELKTIETTTEFFENEKRRSREKRDADRAQEIRERLAIGEAVDVTDSRWLERYETQNGPEPKTNP